MSLDIATSTSNAALAPVSAPDILSAVAGRPDVSRQDVASLHRHLFAEGSIDRA